MTMRLEYSLEFDRVQGERDLLVCFASTPHYVAMSEDLGTIITYWGGNDEFDRGWYMMEYGTWKPVPAEDLDLTGNWITVPYEDGDHMRYPQATEKYMTAILALLGYEIARARYASGSLKPFRGVSG